MSRRGENIYKRKDGRWEGRYIKNRRLDGSIHYGYVYRKSYKEVSSALGLYKVQYQQHYRYQEAYSGPFSQWIDIWLTEEVYPSVKLSTFASYRHKLHTYILPAIGNIVLPAITQRQLQQLVDSWKRSLSTATIHVLFRIMNKSFNDAVKRRHLFENPCKAVQLPKKRAAAVHAISRNEQSKLEQTAQATPQGLPALLALHTGLRMGELAALQWQDIDFDNQVIHVANTYQRLPLPNALGKTQLIYAQAKTASSIRIIPFSGKVKTWLQQKRLHSSQGLFVLGKGEKPIEPRLLAYHFKQLVHKAGLQSIHFHQLRHTFATRCMEAQSDVAAISALLGHASAKMTLDIYTDALLDQRRAVIYSMENCLA